MLYSSYLSYKGVVENSRSKEAYIWRGSRADIVQLLLENHKPVPRKVVIKQDRLAGYFEKEYTSKQIEEIIFQLLDEWSNKQRGE